VTKPHDLDLDLEVGIAGAAFPDSDGVRDVRTLVTEIIRDPRPTNGREERCPADRRIEAFLNAHFADLARAAPLRLPAAVALPRHGLARELSLPADEDIYRNEYVTSYRVRNGVLHNPRSDRRTTKGTFHVSEGGLPIPGDKKAVPRPVFVALFRQALAPPAELLVLPLTSAQAEPVRAFVSLLLRPIVCPEIPGVSPQKSMEVRFFAPGGLVSNLDFVESIFGNAGDPDLPENDAGLDVEHWTGHTGCVLLAPHLTRLTKKELGLPSWDGATERQRRDGMCWRDPGELYNDGQAFKVTCRDAAGVIVTLIADNYYGYCKKEVKTQISYAANLFGSVEEEHAGGALAFARYNLGTDFDAADHRTSDRTLAELARQEPETIDLRPEGHGVDKHCPDLVYVPHDARASLSRMQLWWTQDGREASLTLRPGKTYMTPSGYKVQLDKHPSSGTWRLLGTVAEGLFCHKPCTVSGGGKSEISKSLADYVLYGPILVGDVEKDFDLVQRLFDRDYADRWRPGRGPDYSGRPSRPLLSPLRSLGSVIKLLTPSDDYTPEYNAWLASFPDHIYPVVFLIKRFIPPEAQANWRGLFGVDSIDGRPGHELKALGRRLVGSYLRVGLLSSQGWRTFKLRQDFAPAAKVQMEDDITASAVAPAGQLRNLPPGAPAASYKFAVNCEHRLFQRPDDAVHRGLDRQTEKDLARPDNFLSNFEPLTAEQAQGLVDRVTDFDEFTPPMRELLAGAAAAGSGTVVCSAYPRLVDGKPSKNPRYLQIRPDLLNPQARYIAERGLRLARGMTSRDPLPVPVGAVLIGRRNNPPDRKAGIRPLAVYGPIHYQELPELFMDVICSLTGKSPSTTGAGSEGALTKGPFNALRTIVDLNAALVSYILTGLAGYSTAAGFVGPGKRVDHDISLLIPEIWCRLTPRERDPAFLIAEGHLEPLRDFQHAGRTVLASRLGYRVTAKFARTFLGRVFDHPDRVFDEAYLRPETQDLEAFVDGVHNITEAQQRVALQAFEDGSVEQACPPLRALLSVMAHGAFEGKDAHHPDLRRLFTLDSLHASAWYRERLQAKQRVDERLWRRHVATLDAWLAENAAAGGALPALMRQRRELAAGQLDRATAPGYLDSLHGTLGVEPSLYP
jgi:phosphoenolpyruvate carboxykinase (diphosphate)